MMFGSYPYHCNPYHYNSYHYNSYYYNPPTFAFPCGYPPPPAFPCSYPPPQVYTHNLPAEVPEESSPLTPEEKLDMKTEDVITEDMKKMEQLQLAVQLREAANGIEEKLKDFEPEIPQDVFEDLVWEIERTEDDEEDDEDVEDVAWGIKGRPQSERSKTCLKSLFTLGRMKLLRRKKRDKSQRRGFPYLGNIKLRIYEGIGDSEDDFYLAGEYLQLEEVVNLLHENPTFQFQNLEILKNSLDQFLERMAAKVTLFKEVRIRIQ